MKGRGPMSSVPKAAVAAASYIASKAVPLLVNKMKGYKGSRAGGIPSGKKKNPSRKSRRLTRRRQQKCPPCGNRLQRQVTRLTKQVKSGMGELVYKYRESSRVVCSTNQCAYGNWAGNSTVIDELALAQLRFYNPSTPGTYITSDLTSGTQSKSAQMQVYGSITLRNNYAVPTKVSLYVCVPKSDTSTTPITAITDGLTDLGVTSPSTEIMTFPTESRLFNDIYKVSSSKTLELRAGKEMTISHSTATYTYDPSIVDTHSQIYQKKLQAFVFLVRVHGVLAHDTSVTTEQTSAPAGVDIQTSIKITIHYDAGVNVKYIVVNNTADTSFTNSSRISQITTSQQAYAL